MNLGLRVSSSRTISTMPREPTSCAVLAVRRSRRRRTGARSASPQTRSSADISDDGSQSWKYYRKNTWASVTQKTRQQSTILPPPLAKCGRTGIIEPMRKRKRVYSYQINLIPEEEGGYTVLVPMLPGCVSYGGTIEEATANAPEAIELHLENLAAHKEPIPEG